jgi:hypothetical protein
MIPAMMYGHSNMILLIEAGEGKSWLELINSVEFVGAAKVAPTNSR